MNTPLAYRLRPKTLDEMVGQDAIRQTVRVFFEKDQIPSMIFRGTPGCGKTTLAHVIAHHMQSSQFHAGQTDFFELSGVASKKEDLNRILEIAEKNKGYGKKTLLFLDEIHRRNKAQQDALLPFVESGLITLIGATTENPSFTIINALLSRSKVLIFESLTQEHIIEFFEKNMEKIVTCPSFSSRGKISSDDKRQWEIQITHENLQTIATLAHGDLRSACNLLEASLLLSSDGTLEDSTIKKAFGTPVYYDRDGEEHYNIISAVHKSLRDGDPHAACYWIQRMLMGGEDPRYIARRLLRFASEDIGLADNNALLLANQVYDVVMKLGMPECKVAIFQLALYLAKAPKSNLAYKVDLLTAKDVEKFGNLPVPMVIRNAPTTFMKEVGYGKGYVYAHDVPPGEANNQHFPDELQGRKYF